MLRGLYTVATGLETNNKKLDVVTNNIANIDTVGYKKDLIVSESFPEVLIRKINAPIDYTKIKGIKGVEHKEDGNLHEVHTNEGFFRVQTPNGISFNRQIRFTVNEDGYLSTYYRDVNGGIDTKSGYLVLGNKGPIRVQDGQVSVNEKGQLLLDGEAIDQLVLKTSPDQIGTISAGVRLDRLAVNYGQGQLYKTSNPLDLGIKGKGFFKIDTPQGIRYTRDGSFTLNQQNELVTLDGYHVLGQEGNIIIDGKNTAINEYGEILVDGEYTDTVQMTEIENMQDLRKESSNMYKIADGIELKEKPFMGQVEQGFLEKSNVDAVKEMVRMMSVFRNYESGQKVIKAYDDTLGKAVNEIGKV